MLAALAACSGNTEEGPVGWWHQLQGGYIAQHRPPPPGQDQPYPWLATVPKRPTPVSPAIRASTYAALAKDRSNANYEMKIDPIAEAGAKTTDQGLFAPAVPPKPAPDATGAQLPAATPPPPPAGTSAKSQVTPPPASVSSTSPVDVPIPDIVQDATPAPTVPAAPPPQPRIPGVVLPVTLPHLPPVAPPAPVTQAALTATEAAPVALAFAPGSASLTVADRADLKALAARRGPHKIAITGFGEAAEEDSHSQVLGLTLGLQRAQAVALVLESQGVPAAAIRQAASSGGYGAAVRLTD